MKLNILLVTMLLAIRSVTGNGSSNPTELTAYASKLFFAADDGVNGRELWTSDGYLAGTKIWKDILPGAASSNPTDLTVFQGTLYFVAEDGESGREIWTTTQYTSSPQRRSNIGASADPHNLFSFNDKLWFAANDGENGVELWVGDKYNVFKMWKDIYPGASSSNPADFVVFNGTLYFTAEDAENGRTIYKTGDNQNTVVPAHSSAAAALYSDPSKLTVYTDSDGVSLLYFAASDPVTGRELWVTDTYQNGAKLLIDILEGPGSSEPDELIEYNGQLVFVATDAEKGREIFATNGTAAGTRLIRDVHVGGDSSNPTCLWTGFEGRLYFAAQGSAASGIELWSLEGEFSNKLRDYMDIAGGTASSSPCGFSLSPPKGVQGVYFAADDGVHGRELWYNSGYDSSNIHSDINKHASKADNFMVSGIWRFAVIGLGSVLCLLDFFY